MWEDVGASRGSLQAMAVEGYLDQVMVSWTSQGSWGRETCKGLRKNIRKQLKPLTVFLQDGAVFFRSLMQSGVLLGKHTPE